MWRCTCVCLRLADCSNSKNCCVNWSAAARSHLFAAAYGHLYAASCRCLPFGRSAGTAFAPPVLAPPRPQAEDHREASCPTRRRERKAGVSFPVATRGQGGRRRGRWRRNEGRFRNGPRPWRSDRVRARQGHADPLCRPGGKRRRGRDQRPSSRRRLLCDRPAPGRGGHEPFLLHNRVLGRCRGPHCGEKPPPLCPTGHLGRLGLGLQKAGDESLDGGVDRDSPKSGRGDRLPVRRSVRVQGESSENRT